MHAGIQQGFPRLPGALGAYLALFRPFTWLAPIGGAVSAAWMAARLEYTSWTFILAHWASWLEGAGALLALVVASNCLNQACDPEDRVNKPYRPVARGLIPELVAGGLWAMFTILGLFLSLTGGPVFFVCCTLLAALTVLYNAGPRLKAEPGLGNACIALARGGLGFLAAWSLWAPVTAPPALLGALILTIYTMGATTAKDFHDAAGDAQYGVRTLPVCFGAKKAAWISLPWIALSGAMLWAFHSQIGVDGWFGGVALALMAALCFTMLALPDKQNHLVENTKAWPLYYGALVGLQLALAS